MNGTNIILTWTFSLALILPGVLLLPGNAAGQSVQVNFEETYYDPYDDIQVVAQEGHFVTGSKWRDLDISKMHLKSETRSLVGGIGKTTEISMSVTVRGTVRDDDGYIYGVYLTVGSTEYTIVYKEKVIVGLNMDNGESVVTQYEGVGTSTIVFTVDEGQIGSPSGVFKWNAMAIERSDDGNYGDLAPNKLIKITEPWDRDTVSGNVLVKGECRTSLLVSQKVEIQMDSRSETGWLGVTDKGGWQRWEYSLDTDSLANGEHTVNARLTDEEGSTYFDKITLEVNPDVVGSPPSTEERPQPHIGDKYVFGISEDATDQPEVINIDISTTSDMEATVIGQDEKVGSYDCWKMSTSQSGELTLGAITANFDTEGDIYLEGGFLNVTKEDSTITLDSALTNEQKQHKVSVYSPPKVRYDFPLEVTGVWSADTSANIDVDGKTSTESIRIDYRCLFSESTSVPAGSFDTFAIRSQNDDAAFYKVEYYSPLIGYPVRVETFDIDDQLIGVLVLNSYKMKDTFVKFAGAPSYETEEDSGKVYLGESLEFDIDIKNTGKGKADRALLVGMFKIAGGSGDYVEFDRDGFKVGADSTDTIELTWTADETGEYWFRFLTYSDSSDTSVMDDELVYDEGITVRAKISNGEDGILTGNMPLVYGGIAFLVMLILIIVVIVIKRKKKGPDDFQVVEVAAVEPETEDTAVLIQGETEELMAEETDTPDVVMVTGEEGDTGSSEGEGQEGEGFACPGCAHELTGDESECPECSMDFEDLLSQLELDGEGGSQDEAITEANDA